jgi:hypothetical protein
MKTNANLKATLLVAALLALPLAQAATMTKADYNTEKVRISAAYKADKAACAAFADNAKDICQQEAKGKENIARAELQFSYTGKPGDQTKIWKTKAQAVYAVAKEKCDDLSGNAKDVCVKEAKAAEVKTLADTEMAKDIREVKKDGAQDKMDADYKVALEKCDALAGDAKGSCVAAAKARFNKR